MGNILDYISWRGDLSFEADKVHSVDSLIFAEMSYVDFRGEIPAFPTTEKRLFRSACKAIFAKTPKEKMTLGVIVPKGIVNLTYKAGKSDRFGNTYVSNFVDYYNEEEVCQFAAMTYHFNKNDIYIAFRGTDDSLTGWEENLNMICKFPVKAQQLAAEYVNKVASLFPKAKIYLTGQSKGGNLANYAGMYCNDKIKSRIVKIYSFDGPGFVSKFVDPIKFESVKNKIRLYVSQDDVVGMLFDPFAGKIEVVYSSNKGIFQHDGCSWEVKGCKFTKVKDISENSKKLDEAITELLNKIDDEQRKELAHQVYDYLRAVNTVALSDILKGHATLRFVRFLNKISIKNQLIFMDFFYKFIRYNQL